MAETQNGVTIDAITTLIAASKRMPGCGPIQPHASTRIRADRGLHWALQPTVHVSTAVGHSGQGREASTAFMGKVVQFADQS
jgi:hypothetical protein